MRHSRLWWAAVILPVAIIGGIELLADWGLDPYLPFPYDTLVVTGASFVLAVIFVSIASHRIGLLTGALDARTREVEQRSARARALHQLGVSVAATRDLDTVLRSVTEATRRMLGGEVALVALQSGETATLAASSGPSEALLATTGLAREPADLLAAPFRQSLVAAPLHRGDSTIGSLAVAGRQERSYSVDELETLSSLAALLALAIENARLEAQLRELAVRGERERIAREMHDGLAQVLGYVNTKSQAVEELLRQRRIGDARGQLAELAAAARSIYVDVREAILGLTSPISPERGLVGAVEEYADRFAASSKIAVSVSASPGAAAMALSPEIEAQVFRIVQEALTNVRKHAEAARVEIGLESDGTRLEVTVADDGRGIATPTREVNGATESGGWPHFGMAAMRERAASIGAELDVGPAAGSGTRVCLTLDLRLAAARVA